MKTRNSSTFRKTKLINPQKLPYMNQKTCRSSVVKKLSNPGYFWRQTVESILSAIRESDSKKNLMSYKSWKYHFSKFQKYHLNKDEKLQFFQMVSELIKVNYGEQKGYDQIYFCGESGAKFHKLQNTLHFKHIQSLEYFKFIASEKYHIKQLNQLLFSQLKFDLSQEETIDVAAKVRVFCSKDLNAFVFLSLYLQISVCNKLKTEQFGKVEEQYKARLTLLQKQYPANSSENIHFNLVKKLTTIQSQYEMQKVVFSKNDKNHFEQLKQYIIKKAEDAKKDHPLFEKLVKYICYSKGYGFKSGMKIKSSQNTASIFRTVQKLLEDKMEKLPDVIQVNKIIVQFNQLKRKSFSIIKNTEYTCFHKYLKPLICKEKKQMHLKIQEILDSEQSIVFQVKDLLRGKCTFDTIEDIIETGNLLIRKIQEEGHQVIQLKDKLSKNTKDAVLIIKLPNSIAQLQLVLKLDSVSNEFNHKLYELKRSKLYSPITNLHVHNEKWGQGFFTEQIELLEDIVNIGDELKLDENYKLQDFSKDVQVFKKIYLQQYQISCNKDKQQRVHQNNLIAAQTQSLIEIIKQNKYLNIDQEKRKRNRKSHQVNFSIENKDYKKGLQSLNQVSNNQLQNDTILLTLKGDILYEQHYYKECMECYDKCLKLYMNKVIVTNNQKLKIAEINMKIGLVYQNIGDYPKTLQYYERCLQIQTKIKGKDSIDVSETLNNIGIIYKYKGKYPKALEYYERSLQIRIKIKGKDSIVVAITLNNIGMVYSKKEEYPKALEYCERCLQIQTKIKGIDSFDVAGSLNNIGSIYWNKREYPKALEYYERCLQIFTKIKGKDSFDVAIILNNIGNVYSNKGEYPNALNYFERSLSIKTEIKGKDSIDVAETLNNIGGVYHRKEEYSKALEYYDRCLQIQFKIKGKYSIDVAVTLNNMGIVFYHLGHITQSQEYQKLSQQIKYKINR